MACCAELVAIARQHDVHLLGPNSLSFQRSHLQLNASAAWPLATPGPLALISPSGTLTVSILDWARENSFGFSAVISLGLNTVVELAQALDFLAQVASTKSILIYIEDIRHARRFMCALRAAAFAKPVVVVVVMEVVMKSGRKPAGSQAALTHSAAIVGSDDVFEAALRRAGAVRVRSFTQLRSAAKCLASRYRPVGNRLAVVTNGGGPGVLAADWANEIGLDVATLTDASRAQLASELASVLADCAPLQSLIDLGKDALPEH